VPKITAPIQGNSIEDLSDTVQETVKKVHRILDAKAVAETLKSLGISTDGSSEIRQFSETLSSVVTGLKSMGELQNALVSQVMELMKNGNGSGKTQISDLIGLILIQKLLDSKPKEEISPAMEKLINKLEEEIKELKQSRAPSPVDQQIQSLTAQLLSQHMANLTDPLSSLQKLSQMKKEAKELLAEEKNSVPPEYSEAALRLRALEKEEKALAVEENKFLAQLNHKERLYSQQIPALIQQAGAVLANVLGSYGLTPVRPLQFDKEASAEAQKLTEEEQ